jgi:hypothetical protein
MKLAGDKWIPKESEFSYAAASYQEAQARFNSDFLKMGWGDGLPLLPPTRSRVDALLKGTPLSPTTVIGAWGPANADFTVEKIAIVAAMAGGEPEYMPVILAALKAITSARWDAYFPVMRAPVPLVLVNGPYARKIGINSSANAFGPNPKYHANGAIGRAINLAMASISGNGRGIKPSNLAGNPAAYAGIVIAEAEDIASLGAGWDPVSVQLGYPAGTNLVTVLGIEEMDMSVAGTIANLASCISPHKEIWPRDGKTWDAQYAGALVITEMQRVTEGLMGSKTKADIAKELWESARIPMDKFKTLILTNEFGGPAKPNEFIKSLMDDPDNAQKGMPVAAGPNRFLVVVTGGH